MTTSQTVKPASDAALRIGISSCLLGEKVRWDGEHKNDPFINTVLAPLVEFVPVCPEVEVGMGIPREPIRLVANGTDVRLVGVKSGTDHTRKMRGYAKRRIRELGSENLCGYILKKNSPSCGMERVKVYADSGQPLRKGRGLFAAELMERWPLLPVEEEGRLHDARLRENFYERVFAYRRLRDLFESRWSPGDMVRFHTHEKLLLMAHDPRAYRALGRLVAAVRDLERRQFVSEYQTAFMAGMQKIATVRKHCNVLQHILGHFKGLASPEARSEMLERIEDYRRGLVPLIVPVTLIRYFTRLYDVGYLREQSYLEPHPKELMLRNHV